MTDAANLFRLRRLTVVRRLFWAKSTAFGDKFIKIDIFRFYLFQFLREDVIITINM